MEFDLYMNEDYHTHDENDLECCLCDKDILNDYYEVAGGVYCPMCMENTFAKQVLKSCKKNKSSEEMQNDMNVITDNTLLFAKTKENAIIPTKSESSAGYDVYACFDEDEIRINAHQTKMIPTGICSAMNEHYYVQIEERGSTGSRGIKSSCGVIDSDYRGEWFIALYNSNDYPMVIRKNVYEPTVTVAPYIFKELVYPYSKAIAQAIVLPVPKIKTKEVSMEELQSYKTKRGDGKLGSSGK